jgi:hypothetical protein
MAVLLFFSLPTPTLAPVPRTPQAQTTTRHAREGGRWYLAETGHAVFCYGPVMTVTQPDGGLRRVATFCQGDKTMVPLKD